MILDSIMTHRRLTSEADVKEALGHYIGHEVDDAVWDLLLEDRWVAELLAGESTVQELATRYRRVDKVRRDSPKARNRDKQSDELPPDERLKVLSGLLTREAADDVEVKAFRQDELGGELLTLEHLGDWIERQADADGSPTRFLTVPIPEGHERQSSRGGDWTDPPLVVSKETPAIGGFVQLLNYVVAGEEWGHYIPVKLGGVLDRLRNISDNLARRYDWWPQNATAFILTGLTPPTARGRISLKRHPWYPWLNRLTLDLDPTLPSRTVMDIYRRHRRELVGGRYRPMTTKHLRLAEFYAVNNKASWRQRMEAWNRTYPKWQYADMRNFSRDCRHAWRRIMGKEV